MYRPTVKWINNLTVVQQSRCRHSPVVAVFVAADYNQTYRRGNLWQLRTLKLAFYRRVDVNENLRPS